MNRDKMLLCLRLIVFLAFMACQFDDFVKHVTFYTINL